MSKEVAIVLAAEVLLLLYVIVSVVGTIRAHSRLSWIPFILMTIGVLFLMVLVYRGQELKGADWAQILLTIGLVTITAVYASSTEKQADANVKMVKEMREQRQDATRPIVDIKMSEDTRSLTRVAYANREELESMGLSCSLHNIGVGPAIDVYTFVQNPTSHERQRLDFGTRSTGDTTNEMNLSIEKEGSALAVIACYRDVYGRDFRSKRELQGEKGNWALGHLQVQEVRHK